MVQPSAPALIIAGMHRSGTSLAASLVTSAGMYLGDRLMGPEHGNVKGHFEDLDFYELHQRALAANGLGADGFTCQTSITVPPAVADAFETLVDRRRGLGQPWGWKDPRTTLFLDAWQRKLEEARFLLVFRRPWEVIDSLFRRGDPAFVMNPRLAADVWFAYNRRIHDFFLTHRDRCLLVETTHVARNPGSLIAAVGRLLGIELRMPEVRYEPGLLLENTSFDRVRLVRQMLPAAIDLYDSLQTLASDHVAPASRRPLPAAADQLGADDLVDAAALQWVRAARAEQSGQARAAELAAMVQEVMSLREQLDRTQRRRTFRHRLSVKSRHLARRARDIAGLAWLPDAASHP